MVKEELVTEVRQEQTEMHQELSMVETQTCKQVSYSMLQLEQAELERPIHQQVDKAVEVLQEGDGYDGAAFVADLLGFQDDNAQVRYHAFNESEDSDTKLVDWVAVRRLRPLPAYPISFCLHAMC